MTSVIDDRCLNLINAFPIGELVQREIAEMIGIAYDDVSDDIILASDQEDGSNLVDLRDFLHEAIDDPPIVLGQLQHEDGLKADLKRAQIVLDMAPENNSALFQTFDALVAGRMCHTNASGYHFIGGLSVILQNPQNLEIYSVKLQITAPVPD